MRRTCLIVALWGVLSTAPVMAQMAPSDISLPVYQQGDGVILDWNSITFSDFAPIDSDGEIAAPGGSKYKTFEWKQGDRFADLFTLGDIAALEPQKLSLDDVSELTQEDPGHLVIADMQLYAQQSVDDLVNAIPGLKDLDLGAAQPLLDLADTYFRDRASRYIGGLASQKIGDLLGSDSGFGQKKLSDLGQEKLQQYLVSQIPGMSSTEFEKYAGWSQQAISKIKNLDKVPIGTFQPSFYMPVAVHDVSWGHKEADAIFKPITGGNKTGYSVPCVSPRPGGGTGCASIELSDYRGSLGALGLNGAHWIKGGKEADAMMVPGGYGPYGAYNGGKEPVGRPLGSEFKIVLREVDEAVGTAKFSIYGRKCDHFPIELGCTPKAIGGFHFFTSRETGMVFLGTPTPSGSYAASDSGKWVEKQATEVSQEVAKEADAVEVLKGFDDCDKRALGVVDPNLGDRAASLVPQIIDDANDAGLSINQTAVILAVAQEKYQFNPTLNSQTLVNQVRAAAQQFVTDSVIDYAGAVSASGLGDASRGANTASDFQAALKPCEQKTCSSSGNYIRPTSGPITSEMGMRFHPIYQTWRLHAGIDVAPPTGTPVKAADCGTVIYSGWESGYGKVVVIEHAQITTRSAHLSSALVQEGDVVAQGQPIGFVGSTGGVTGPHLHWETRPDGRWGDPVDPRNYVTF